MMKFGKKVMAAMMMGLVTASAVAGGGGKGEGRSGHEGGPSKTMHAGGPGGLALFGIGPFGARPMMLPGKPGEPPQGDKAGQGAREGAVGQAAGALTDEQRARRFEQHLETRIARVLRRVDGTPEQSRKIAAVVAKAMIDMQPLHEQLRALDRKAADLFKADTLDRQAFGQLRAERLTLMDQISQRSMSAWLDAASLLDAGQRQKLGELRERGGRGGHRGRDGQRHAHGKRGEPGQRVERPAAAGNDQADGAAR